MAVAVFAARPAALAAIVVSALLIFGVEAWTAYSIAGVNLLENGDDEPTLTAAALASVFAAGTLVSLPLMFVPFAALFDDASFTRAFATSVRGFALNVLPLLIFGALALVLVLIGLLSFGFGLIAVFPLLSAASYAAWKDVYAVAAPRRLDRRRDFELREIALGRFDPDGAHRRCGRPPVRPRNDRVDVMGGARHDRLDVAIPAIAHPTAEPQRARLVGQRIAEADALYAPFDHQAFDEHRCQDQCPAARLASSSSPIIVLLSVMSPRSSQRSASSSVALNVSMNSPSSSCAPTCVSSSAMKMSICSVE